MRSRSTDHNRRRRPVALVALAGLTLLGSACLPSTGDPMEAPSWGINAGGQLEGWYADTNETPSPFVNVGDADLRTSMSSARVDVSHASARDAAPEAVYQTQRAVRPGAPMRWVLPLPGGADEVRLHFAETRDRFFQKGGTVTDVAVNGEVVIDDLDVFAEVGANKALVKSVDVSGDLAVVELRAEAGWPSIAAVEVVGGDNGTTVPTPAPTPTTTKAPAPTTTKAPAPTTTKAPAPPTTQAPAPTVPSKPAPEDGRKLSFKPPALSNPTTIHVSNTNRALRLEDGKDYIIKMPSTPLDASGGLNINGGRNVVLIGGHIHFSRWYTGASIGKVNRGMYLQNQTGTLHIEGVLISGNIGEGIDLSQTRGGVVQLQNIRIEGASGTQEANHADLIQSWAGPRQLKVDGFTGTSNYQGFFLLPNQWYDGPAPELFDFRNVNLAGQPSGAGYMLWVDGARQKFPVRTDNVWAKPSTNKAGQRDQFLWPQPKTGDQTWSAVREGTPPGGDIVTRAEVGTGYVSPGYTG